MDDHEDSGPAAGQPADESNLTPIPAAAEDRAHGATHSDPPQVPSKAEVLEKMSKMPGLIAMGLLTPPKANAMRSVFSTILDHLDSGSPTSMTACTDDNVLAILRQQPELLKLVEPLLTAEQIQFVLRAAPQ